jgi:hypothetical protein
MIEEEIKILYSQLREIEGVLNDLLKAREGLDARKKKINDVQKDIAATRLKLCESSVAECGRMHLTHTWFLCCSAVQRKTCQRTERAECRRGTSETKTGLIQHCKKKSCDNQGRPGVYSSSIPPPRY